MTPCSTSVIQELNVVDFSFSTGLLYLCYRFTIGLIIHWLTSLLSADTAL